MKDLKPEDIIYIDWNIFSILKNPKLEPHIILNKFLNENERNIKLVYSDAHLGDLTKTSERYDDLRNEDLKYLSGKTKNLTIVKYFGRENYEIDYRSAKEFYNQNKFDNESEQLAPLALFTKQMTSQYGGLRDDIILTHFKTDPKNICNFSVGQMEELIKMTGICNSLKEFVELGLSLRGDTTRNPLTYVDYYMTAYMNLDLIGFFPDSMEDPGSFNNLLNDSKHSAYGSLCKAFITNDNKCFHKSRFLFEYYGSKSKLIKTCRIKNRLGEYKKELQSLVK